MKGEVSAAQFFFLRRTLKEAEANGASAVILEIDTNGGDAMAMLDQIQALLQVKVPTIAWVNDKAFSAGALFSLAAKEIWMAPSASIGAAAVVNGSGEDLQETMRAKSNSAILSKIRFACERNGHSPDVAEAFVIIDKELKIGETVIDGPKQLLSLTALEATKKYNGRPLLAAGIASSIEELTRANQLTGPIRRLAPSGFEHFAFWITALAPLFLLGGVVCGYIEFKTPGFGVPGIIALICFGLYFFGHQVAGLAGSEGFVLFLLGLVLVVLELTVLHGTFLPLIAGVLLMLTSVTWAMVDRWPGDSLVPTGSMLAVPMRNLLFTGILSGFAIYFLARWLPKTAFYGRLVMQAVSGPTPAPNPVGEGHSALKIGETGIAATILRPSGKMSVGNTLYDVTADGGDFVPAGTPIRVVDLSGMCIRVERVS
jgi:membrane-bound serine protease (ClpP class)